MDKFEQHISKALQNDGLQFSPNENIHDRLMYHMQLKSTGSTVRKNQFLPSLGGLLTAKILVWKVSFAAILLISFMGYQHFTPKSSSIQLVDSTRYVQPIDTANFMIEDTAIVN